MFWKRLLAQKPNKERKLVLKRLCLEEGVSCTAVLFSCVWRRACPALLSPSFIHPPSAKLLPEVVGKEDLKLMKLSLPPLSTMYLISFPHLSEDVIAQRMTKKETFEVIKGILGPEELA